jgi:hypothetical protein
LGKIFKTIGFGYLHGQGIWRTCLLLAGGQEAEENAWEKKDLFHSA